MATQLFRQTPAPSSNGQAAPPTAPTQRGDSPSPPLLGPPSRRRPAMLVAGVMLAAIGALVAVTTAMAAGDRSPVLVVVHDVAAGARLTDADLGVARIADDAQLHPVAASARASAVGRRAVTGLTAGTLLTAAMLTDNPAPTPGTAIVPVAFKANQLPARALQAGDRLLVVPAAAERQQQSLAGVPVRVTVAEVGPTEEDGTVVLDLLAPDEQAATLAAQAAGGQVALVLLSGAGS